jgi:putative heme-binding domain-containing protein
MFRATPLILILLVIPLPFTVAQTPKLENWADPNLKITDGLELWLDSARQNAAQRALKLPELSPGSPIPVWYDASGKGRHLVQKDAASRPLLQTKGGYAALRFDGERQHLNLPGLNRSFKEVTVFLVAAPFGNPGDFRGFLAFNQEGKNDYVSGLTIDQGFDFTLRFQSLNVEGAGFLGAVNLLKASSDFGTVQRFCVTSAMGPGGTKLYLNGKFAGQRDRGASTLHMDRLTVGARYYTNGGPPEVRGFLEGDILEVLIYNRVLTDAERAAIEKYLTDRHGDRRKVPIPGRPTVGKPLVSVANPPPVQMLVPGFSVRQLPVDLSNINNVQYRADGKLVALAYDGNVYLLSDSDGDGLEDRVELFWENKGRIRAPIGMALTPSGYKHGDGLFVASKGKCSLLVDSKGTGKADKELVLAQGWEELPHGVDALGVALDPRDGSVYFGLGTASYENAYQVDKQGRGHYRLSSERGTILRVAPDFKGREIVCTGIRFPVAMRFNRAGDLFCTDQEGATWLPNGNPFDELLHIQKGRHYGFPPRHPTHLPNVIDEPSVFDYDPQHQSTCGLNFNEPVNGGPVFGPSWWASDAIVTGYSRGKLYRTRIVKSEAGYVAHNQLLAALNMLAVDACVSPKGDLVVAVHGGGPDWGNGPNGKGKLYKITYTGKDLAQPVLVWAQGPREVRVAFDRPLDPQHLRDLVGKVAIEYGRYVAAGDRFEKHRPGYRVVQDQIRTPRFELPVLGVQVTNDRRALILATAAHPETASYAITLPGLGRKTPGPGELPQVLETDLRYDLCGVEASWRGKDGGSWTGWLPHFDLDVARALTAPSSAHEELWKLLGKPGSLTLRTKLNLWQMLRPAVQPGSKLGYSWPDELVTVEFRSTEAVQVEAPVQSATGSIGKGGGRSLRLTMQPAAENPIPFEVVLPTGLKSSLSVSYHTNEDPRPRALPLHRLLLPWAALKKATLVAKAEISELKGGDWERGRRVFFGEPASCFKCHAVGGEGGKIGPDLSNLVHRDYGSVLRDIAEPSYALHPDYITQVIELNDGRVLTGAVRTEGNKIHVGDLRGDVTTIRLDQVNSMISSPVSVMPEGLPKLLGPDRMRDLLTFLLTERENSKEGSRKDAKPQRGKENG